MDSKLKTVQHLKHLCVENGGKGKRLRQLQSQDDMLTHTWESLKTVPESVLLAGGRSSKSRDPFWASFPRTRNTCLESIWSLARWDSKGDIFKFAIKFKSSPPCWTKLIFKKYFLDSHLIRTFVSKKLQSTYNTSNERWPNRRFKGYWVFWGKQVFFLIISLLNKYFKIFL